MGKLHRHLMNPIYDLNVVRQWGSLEGCSTHFMSHTVYRIDESKRLSSHVHKIVRKSDNILFVYSIYLYGAIINSTKDHVLPVVSTPLSLHKQRKLLSPKKTTRVC